MTLTVTEAGYVRGPDGGLDVDEPGRRRSRGAARATRPPRCRPCPARLVAGLAARRAAGAGAAHRRVLRQPARQRRGHRPGGRRLRAAARPRPGRLDRPARLLRDHHGRPDHPGHRRGRHPVGGRPDAPDGRPRPWSPSRSASGCSAATSPAAARPGTPPAPGSSTTSPRSSSESCGCSTAVTRCSPTPAAPAGTRPSPQAVADPVCREWLQQWWAEASAHLTLPADEVADYRDALLDRFANPRIRHLLAQIAADGSQKLPVRVLPVVRAERGRAGSRPAPCASSRPGSTTCAAPAPRSRTATRSSW